MGEIVKGWAADSVLRIFSSELAFEDAEAFPLGMKNPLWFLLAEGCAVEG